MMNDGEYLMYVSSTGGGFVNLRAFHGTFAAALKMAFPDEILKQVEGRQCWAKGKGANTSIIEWVDLPTSREKSGG